VGAVVNGKTKGLQEELKEDAEVRFVKAEDKEGKEIFWHTSAHIMALAVQRLFPDVKFAIGPAIENGFYYDFDTEHRFTPEDLAAIEAEMRKIVKEKLPLERSVLSRAEALDFFSARDEVYKVDLIENLPEEEEISLYSMGEFSDLCAGPHLPDSSKVKAIHLMAIAGAYWRGDEKNKMLQRIYGISFEKKKELDEYLQFLEEAKRRDHRKLGQELKLFSIKEQGPGFVFFHPNGMIMRNAIEDFWRKVHKKHAVIDKKGIVRQTQFLEYFIHNFRDLRIIQNMQRIMPDNIDIALIEFPVTPFLFSFSAIDFADLIAVEGKLEFRKMLGNVAGQWNRQIKTQGNIIGALFKAVNLFFRFPAPFGQEHFRLFHYSGIQRIIGVAGKMLADYLQHFFKQPLIFRTQFQNAGKYSWFCDRFHWMPPSFFACFILSYSYATA
jgi:Ser-tRNA(Ala) deacylase AlaX